MADEESSFSLDSFLSLAQGLARPPELYERRGSLFWQDPWTSRKALGIQLDPEEKEGARSRELALAQIDEIGTLIPEAPPRVLDLGCGPGYHLSGYAATGARVRGIDISPAAIEQARGEREAQRPEVAERIELTQGDMLTLSWGAADLVLLLFGEFCLLTPGERTKVLEKAAAALDPGGHLLLELFNQPVEEVICEQTWEVAQEGEGFWSPNRYVELTATFVYPRAEAVLHRFGILEEGKPPREERIWETSMDDERLATEAAEAGLRVIRTLWDHPLFDGGGSEEGRRWFLALLAP